MRKLLAGLIAAFTMSVASANAQVCPAVGADTDCGIIITITNTGSSVSFTGQGPYDTIEDTLVGVVNNSNYSIHSIGLRSALPIFAFDGDGICGTSPITGLPYSPAPADARLDPRRMKARA